MGLVSFRSPWASIILFDSRTKAGSALKTQRPYGPSVTELGWTQVHRLPAQHFSPGLLCSSESLRHNCCRIQLCNLGGEGGEGTGGVDKAHPPGPHHSFREHERMAWSTQANREPWKQTGKRRRSRGAGQKNSPSKWFHFANSIAKTDGFSSKAGEQIMKSAFPRQSGLKSFILKTHAG